MCQLSVAVPETRKPSELLWQRCAAIWLAKRRDLGELPEGLVWRIEQSDLAIGCSAYGWRQAASCEHCLPARLHKLALPELGYWSSKPRHYAIALHDLDDADLLDWLQRRDLAHDANLIIWAPCW